MESQPDTLDFITVLAYIRYEITDILDKCATIENMKERAVLLISFIDSKEASYKDSGLSLYHAAAASFQNDDAIRIIKQEVMNDAYNEDNMDSSSKGYRGFGRQRPGPGFYHMEWKVDTPDPEAVVTLDDDSTEDEGGKVKGSRKRKMSPWAKKRGKSTRAAPVKMTKSGNRQCPTCDKTFMSNSGLRKHLRLHTGLPTYTCSWCKRDFKRKEDLKLHLVREGHINFADKNKDEGGILAENEMNKYIAKLLVCEFCDKLFDRQSAFKSHMKVHVNEMPTEEGQDNQGSGDPNESTDNQSKNRSGEGNMQGNIDDGNYLIKQGTALLSQEISKRPMETGYMRKEPVRSFTNVASKSDGNLSGTHEMDRMVCYRCPFCPFFCYEQFKMKEHEETHSGERPFKCDKCHKTFTIEKTLEQHMMVHSEEKPYQCNVCNKCFSTQSQLFTHEYTHTGISRYICEKCSATFSSKAGLQRHMNFHLGKRDHICDKCGKGFFAKSELTGHIKFHHKKKIFRHKCEICAKAFFCRGELNKHMTVHSEDRPFMCACCGKGFSRKTYLTKHMIIHTSERPYKCSKCTKAFSFISNLTAHERIHTGEKPYSCHVCGKRSSDVANHIKHMRIHKKDKPADMQLMPSFDPSFVMEGTSASSNSAMHIGSRSETSMHIGSRAETGMHIGSRAETGMHIGSRAETGTDFVPPGYPVYNYPRVPLYPQYPH